MGVCMRIFSLIEFHCI